MQYIMQYYLPVKWNELLIDTTWMNFEITKLNGKSQKENFREYKLICSDREKISAFLEMG